MCLTHICRGISLKNGNRKQYEIFSMQKRKKKFLIGDLNGNFCVMFQEKPEECLTFISPLSQALKHMQTDASIDRVFMKASFDILSNFQYQSGIC